MSQQPSIVYSSDPVHVYVNLSLCCTGYSLIWVGLTSSGVLFGGSWTGLTGSWIPGLVPHNPSRPRPGPTSPPSFAVLCCPYNTSAKMPFPVHLHIPFLTKIYNGYFSSTRWKSASRPTSFTIYSNRSRNRTPAPTTTPPELSSTPSTLFLRRW